MAWFDLVPLCERRREPVEAGGKWRGKGDSVIHTYVLCQDTVIVIASEAK